MEEEVIGLSESYFTYLINLACSENELEDSIDQVPVPVNVRNPDKPIVFECETHLNLPEVTIAKKSLPSKKKRKSRTSTEPSRSSERERSPHLGYCPICLDLLGTHPMASTKCGHVYCIKCIERVIKKEKKCPKCRKPLRGAAAFHPLFL